MNDYRSKIYNFIMMVIILYTKNKRKKKNMQKMQTKEKLVTKIFEIDIPAIFQMWIVNNIQ